MTDKEYINDMIKLIENHMSGWDKLVLKDTQAKSLVVRGLKLLRNEEEKYD